jgi:hypothetical protein
MSDKNKIEYPDELTFDQIECYKALRIFEDLKKAKGYAEKTGGQIYTQVDGDTDRIYSKGIHYVNRTGMYAVIK